jgi:TRAP transporter TAXI family solute receptor
MKYINKFAAAGIAALTLVTTSAQAEVVTIATGAEGSLAYNSGQAIAKVANGHGITARTQPIVGYHPLLNAGELDFGFASSVEAEYAYTGTGNYNRAMPNLRMVGVMFPLTTGIMAPADLNLNSIHDLKGRSDLRIASEYTSSTIIPFYIGGALANGGMGYDDFENVPVANFVAGIKALGNGLVDVALVSLNNGAGKEANIKLKDRGGLQYISLDDSAESVAAFKEFLPAAYLRPMKQNNNILGLNKQGANIVAIPWVMMTHADADEETVYKLTKVVAENNAALKSSFGLFGLAKTATMAPANKMPYHPGALRYYREAGIKVGE